MNSVEGLKTHICDEHHTIIMNEEIADTAQLHRKGSRKQVANSVSFEALNLDSGNLTQLMLLVCDRGSFLSFLLCKLEAVMELLA